MMNQRAYHRFVVKSIGRIEKDLNRKSFNCLYPDCVCKAIKSHSQHKEGQLRAISEDGCVYAIHRNMYSLYDPKRTHVVELVKTPIANASTFPGYCSQHDASIFSPIETRPLVQGDKRQALILFLRAFSLEFAAKRRAFHFQKGLIAAVAPHVPQWRTDLGQHALAGIRLFLDREGPFYFRKLFHLLQHEEFDSITVQWTVVKKNLLASSSCCINPYLDDYENHHSPESSEPQPLVAFSLVPTMTETHVVASWLKEHQETAAWIANGLSRAEELEKTLNVLAVAESEDTCFNPSLWESLPEETRDLALEAMRSSTFRGPLQRLPLVVKLGAEERA